MYVKSTNIFANQQTFLIIYIKKMDTAGERLRYYLEYKEVTDLKKFCNTHNLAYTSFIAILTGDRNLGINVLKKLLDIFPALNANWIITGLGNMELSENDLKKVNHPGVELALEMLENPIIQNRIKDITSQ